MKLFNVYALDHVGDANFDELVLAKTEEEALEWYKSNGEFELNAFDEYGCFEIKEISGKRFKISLVQ